MFCNCTLQLKREGAAIELLVPQEVFRLLQRGNFSVTIVAAMSSISKLYLHQENGKLYYKQVKNRIK